MSGELHEAIEEAIESVHGPLSRLTLDIMADAILAMPEMEAIRVALRDLTASWHHHAGAAVLRDAYHLPQSVIDWALGGPS